MIIYVDIDDTVCRTTFTEDFSEIKSVEPYPDRIAKVNKLYDEGHTIIYWTARGTQTGVDWRASTEEQFSSWGVKYHDLKFGKPVYDLFIDDKNVNSEAYFNEQL